MPDLTKSEDSRRISREEESVRRNPAALAQLLDEWMRGDTQEQRDTFETLRRSLDDTRPAGYKLFS